MARELSAFISYRRRDHFIASQPGLSPELDFIAKLKQALTKLGVVEIFFDAEDIGAGDQFEGRIHRHIAKCDIFIELIGRDWLRLLHERQQSGTPDILVQEIISALQLDKDIVPLCIDGASMPRAEDLPFAIQGLVKSDAKPVSTQDTQANLVEALRVPVEAAAKVRRIGTNGAISYAVAAILAWIVAAVLPNIVGMLEFGPSAWIGMAASWAGMFIYPFFFFPFILYALARPMKTLVEAGLNAPSGWDALRFYSPVVFGALLAVPITFVEISAPQVPWTIHPQLQEDCHGPDDPGPPQRQAAARATYLADRKTLSSYGETPAFRAAFDNEFWMHSPCWPNVFFYLTAPVAGETMQQAHIEERAKVVDAFRRYLGIGTKEFKGTPAPYSRVFWPYVAAFYTMVAVLFSAVAMVVIYAAVSIVRPRDGKVLHVPTEDAFLCITYAFVTLMVWVPFRMSTNWTKTLYVCAGTPDSCAPRLDVFMKDTLFGFGLFVGYSFLILGMLWNHKRLLLAFLGTSVVAACIATAYLIVRYYDQFGHIASYWQTWMGLSLILCVILIGLWFLFDPAIVRFRDVRHKRKWK